MTQKQVAGSPDPHRQTHAWQGQIGKTSIDKDNQEQIIDKELGQQLQLINNNRINRKWMMVAGMAISC